MTDIKAGSISQSHSGCQSGKWLTTSTCQIPMTGLLINISVEYHQRHHPVQHARIIHTCFLLMHFHLFCAPLPSTNMTFPLKSLSPMPVKSYNRTMVWTDSWTKTIASSRMRRPHSNDLGLDRTADGTSTKQKTGRERARRLELCI